MKDTSRKAKARVKKGKKIKQMAGRTDIRKQAGVTYADVIKKAAAKKKGASAY